MQCIFRHAHDAWSMLLIHLKTHIQQPWHVISYLLNLQPNAVKHSTKQWRTHCVLYYTITRIWSALSCQNNVSPKMCAFESFTELSASFGFHWKSGRFQWNTKEARSSRKLFKSKDTNETRFFGVTLQYTHIYK